MTKKEYLDKFEAMRKTALFPILPALAVGGKWLLGALATGAVASGLGQAGRQVVDWSNTDDKEVAKSLFSGKFDTLSDSQRKLLQKYKQKYNINLDDVNSRNSAATKIQDSIQRTKDWVGNGIQLVSYATPYGLMKAPVKAAFKKGLGYILPQVAKKIPPAVPATQKLFSKATGKKMLKDMVINYGLFHGLPSVLGFQEPKTQTAQRAAAELPQDLTQFKPSENIQIAPQQEGGLARAGRIGDALLLGIPGFVSGLIKDKAVGTPREITQADLAQAKLQLQNQGMRDIPTQSIVARAKENLFNEKAAQKFLQVPAGDLQQAKKVLSGYATRFEQLRKMSPEQREQALKQLMSSGGDLSPRHVAAAAAALEDRDFAKELFSNLYKTPQELVQLAKEFKNLNSGSMSSTPAGTLLQNLLQGAITQDAALRYVSGLQSAQDKFGFVKQWLDASKEIARETGTSLQNPEIGQVTNKILWGQLAKNPLKLNKILALKAYQSGFNGVGDFLSNSTAFYGTLAAAVPLTVMLMHSVFGGNNEEGQQQTAMMPAYTNMLQAYPVRRNITDKGLIVG